MASYVSAIVAIASVIIAVANAVLVVWSRRSLAKVDTVKIMETTFVREIEYLRQRVADCEQGRAQLTRDIDKLRTDEERKQERLRAQVESLAADRDRLMRRILKIENGGRRENEGD